MENNNEKDNISETTNTDSEVTLNAENKADAESKIEAVSETTTESVTEANDNEAEPNNEEKPNAEAFDKPISGEELNALLGKVNEEAPAPTIAEVSNNSENPETVINNNTIPGDTNNKKSNGAVVALAALAVLIVGLIIGVVLLIVSGNNLFLSPKQRVMYAITNAIGKDNVMSALVGNKKVKNSGNFAPYNGASLKQLLAIKDNMKEKGAQYSFDITLNKFKSDEESEKAYSKIAGAHMSYDLFLDGNNKKAYSELYLKYLAFKLLDAEIFVDDSDVAISFGDYLDGYIAFNTEKFSKDYKKSVLAEELDEDIPNISFNVFELFDEIQDLNYDYKNFIDETGDYAKLSKELYDSIEVNKTGAVETYNIGGKDVKCSEYEIIINEDNVENYFDSYEDFIKTEMKNYYEKYFDFIEDKFNNEDIIEFKDEFFEDYDEAFKEGFKEAKKIFAKDYKVYVYLDNKGRLIGVYYDDTLKNSNGDKLDVTVDLAWLGEKYLADKFDGSIKLKADEEVVIKLTNDGETNDKGRTDKFVIDIDTEDKENDLAITVESSKDSEGKFNNEYRIDHPGDKQYISLSAEGTEKITDDFYELNIEDCELNLSLDEKRTLGFSIYYSIGTLVEEIPEPKGKKYEIFKMDEDELEDMVDYIYDHLYNLGNLFD